MADIRNRLNIARTKLFRRNSGLNSSSNSSSATSSPTSIKPRAVSATQTPAAVHQKSSTSSLRSRYSKLAPPKSPQISAVTPQVPSTPQKPDVKEDPPARPIQSNKVTTRAQDYTSETVPSTAQLSNTQTEKISAPLSSTTAATKAEAQEEEENEAISSDVPAPATASTPDPESLSIKGLTSGKSLQIPKSNALHESADAAPEALGSLPNSGVVENGQAAVELEQFKRKESILPPLPDFSNRPKIQTLAKMSRRKIWIKRTGASATTVQSTDDDLVDDIRDMVLRKYANSLGRCFDSPDVTIRIVPRERGHTAPERTLNPEEPIHAILDSYYPGGQTVEEALIIDVPQKRTPRPSPRAFNNFAMTAASAIPYENHQQPPETGTDYFPPMAPNSNMASVSSHEHRHSHSHSLSQSQPYHPHSISIVETGQLPPLPSPRERKGHHRPRPLRQHTSSPTIVASQGAVTNGSSGHRNSRSDWANEVPPAKHVSARSPNINGSIPTPPAPDLAQPMMKGSSTPPIIERVASPRPGKSSKYKKQSPNSDSRRVTAQDDRRKNSFTQTPLHLDLFESAVPPINVLIVEDNIINLRLLEMFTKRLKVRWQTAMNGRDAVTKWRSGGFHLVLMDIQLPIMSGLEATKEIRRLERVNGIGVFAKSEAEKFSPLIKDGEAATEQSTADDKLSEKGLFRSPVIIVALTASSLQSDRHEALAAGCNDFLTKPVHFNWLERKVMEWGCMQALIDFDGWRKWRDIAAEEQKMKEKNMDPEAKAKAERKEARRAAVLAKMGQK